MQSKKNASAENPNELHSKALVIDSHNDTIVAHIQRGYLSLFDDVGSTFNSSAAEFRLLSGSDPVGTIGLVRGPASPVKDAANIQIDFPKMERAGIDVAFFAVDVTLALQNHLAYAVDGFGWFLDELDKRPGDVVLVRKSDDIRKAKASGAPAALLAIEHADGVEGSLHILRSLYEMGVRSIGLTHNRSSLAADGCGEARSGVGLTRFGKSLIQEMNRLGIIVDLAHASPSAFYHALEVSEKPVLFSHGNAAALCNHQRNLDDRQLEALAKADGVLGMSFVPYFIDDQQPSLERLLDHIDHVRAVAGIDVIGIGSDFDGGGSLMNDADSYPTLTAGLVDRDYSDLEIRKILGENTLRILDSVL
jgi:membrane dipeptidase